MDKKKAERISNGFNKFLNTLLALLIGGVVGIVATKVQIAEAQGKPKPNPLTGQCAPVESSNRLKVGYLTEVERGTRIKLVFGSGQVVLGWLVNVKTDVDVLVVNVGTPEDPHHAFFKAVALESCDPEPLPEPTKK